MKSISVKLGLLFILIILISSGLSFSASTLFPHSVRKEMQQNQLDIANQVRQLSTLTDLPVDEITSITTTSTYHVYRLNEPPTSLSTADLDELGQGTILFQSVDPFVGTTALFQVDEELIQISLYPDTSMFAIVVSRIRDSLLLFIIVGILLIIAVVHRVVRPIVRLTAATQQVAMGDFDIDLEANSVDEIGQLTDNFNRMVRELRNTESLRRDFSVNVVHEISTPLASIQGFAKILQKPGLCEEERTEYAEIIVEETAKLSRLTSNMMKICKLENQEIVEPDTAFSLDEQIRRSILLLATEWESKHIDFDVDLAPAIYIGNEDLLQQVWLNLIGNAVKFSADGGLITVSIRKQKNELLVSVADQGIGMSQEVISRIFERFYQGDSSRSNAGSGLGLTLVKRIVEMHRGHIEVQSSPGMGSIFAVILPFKDGKK